MRRWQITWVRRNTCSSTSSGRSFRRRMGLRSKLVVALCVVALFATVTSLLAVECYLSRGARERLAAEVERSVALYRAVYEAHTARRVAENQVIADEPRLKAIVRTTDIDAATLQDVADEIKRGAHT